MKKLLAVCLVALIALTVLLSVAACSHSTTDDTRALETTVGVDDTEAPADTEVESETETTFSTVTTVAQ